jgi:hypothetical protein
MKTLFEIRATRLATGVVVGISTIVMGLATAPMVQASSSTKEGRIGAVVLILLEEEGCSSISGSVGSRMVTLDYSDMWGYSGRVGRASIDMDYSDFSGYYGSVGRDRVDMDYSDFSGYYGSVGRDRVDVDYSDFSGFSGSIGSQQVRLSCN